MALLYRLCQQTRLPSHRYRLPISTKVISADGVLFGANAAKNDLMEM